MWKATLERKVGKCIWKASATNICGQRYCKSNLEAKSNSTLGKHLWEVKALITILKSGTERKYANQLRNQMRGATLENKVGQQSWKAVLKIQLGKQTWKAYLESKVESLEEQFRIGSGGNPTG